MKKFLIIGGIVLVVLAVGFFVVLPRISASAQSTTTTYQTTVAGVGEISTYVSGTGNARAKQSTTVKWQTSGTVASVNVQLGDQVTAGEVLAQLDQVQGAYWVNNGTLYVHPQGNVTPSRTATDFWSDRGDPALVIQHDHIVLDGFRIWYADGSSVASMPVPTA